MTGHLTLGQPGLHVGETYGILGLAQAETGESDQAQCPAQLGRAGSVFSRFMRGDGCSRPAVLRLVFWSCCFGKVQVALFSVIALALFSVITFWARLAKWPSFRLSRGLVFGLFRNFRETPHIRTR